MLQFVRVNKACYYIVDLYEIGTIKKYTDFLLGKPNTSYLKGWDEFIYRLSSEMEDEIQQTILTNNRVGIVHLMELLDGWANDYRVKSICVEEIIQKVNIRNENEYESYLVKLEEKVAEFQKTEHYKTLNHLDTYELFFYSGGSSIFLSRSADKGTKIVYDTATYYKYYCNELDSGQIDLDAVRTLYVNFITPLIENFRNIAQRYVARFKNGYIDLPGHNFSHQFAPVEINKSEQKKLSDSNIENRKLKFNLTINQLAVFFKLLKEAKLISSKSDAEIQRFIIDNITTPGSNSTKISKSNLANAFSKKDGKSTSDIIKFLRKMIEEAGSL